MDLFRSVRGSSSGLLANFGVANRRPPAENMDASPSPSPAIATPANISSKPSKRRRDNPFYSSSDGDANNTDADHGDANNLDDEAAKEQPSKRPKTVPSTSTTRTSPGGILNPTPGTVYQAKWDNKPWALVVVPGSDFTPYHIKGRILNTGLMAEMPPCTRFYMGKLEWADGYQDGQEKVGERQYPIMWFDEEMKISKRGVYDPNGQLDWVYGRDLAEFDPEDLSAHDAIGGWRLAREYCLMGYGRVDDEERDDDSDGGEADRVEDSDDGFFVQQPKKQRGRG
ncbi:hypothetical protein OQA88_1092 [Cercophora sp. LCS_1]